jgi:hypothetical protein
MEYRSQPKRRSLKRARVVVGVTGGLNGLMGAGVFGHCVSQQSAPGSTFAPSEVIDHAI